jgi:hypothetical protein
MNFGDLVEIIGQAVDFTVSHSCFALFVEVENTSKLKLAELGCFSAQSFSVQNRHVELTFLTTT